MFRQPCWAVGSCSLGPIVARTVGTKSTGGCNRPEWSPCTYTRLNYSLFAKYPLFSQVSVAYNIEFVLRQKYINIFSVHDLFTSHPSNIEMNLKTVTRLKVVTCVLNSEPKHRRGMIPDGDPPEGRSQVARNSCLFDTWQHSSIF